MHKPLSIGGWVIVSGMAMHSASGNTENHSPTPILIEQGVIQDSMFLNRFASLTNDFEWYKVDEIRSGVGLVFSSQGLALRNADQPQHGDVIVDFLSPALAYRKAHGGGRSELLAKAIGVKGNDQYHVIDATAGLGKDAFVLASVGCQVTMFERSPLVAALLEDALFRLNEYDPEHWLAKQLHLHKGDSVELLKLWRNSEQVAPHAIYLDPMFPHRKKSALVKKEMQALQTLLGVDPDADELLIPALDLATKRVVVKRPASAPFLNARKPNLSMSSKKHRFDIYLK